LTGWGDPDRSEPMRLRKISWAPLVALGLVFGACGSDSEDEYYSQVLFRVEAQNGGACVRLDHIASGGARHELPADRVFILESGETQSIVLANAPPPYRARFEWVETGCPDSSGVIVVSGLEIQGPSAEPRVLDASRPVATLVLRVDADAPFAEEMDSHLVRFEVCAPPTREEGCTSSISGRIFTGSIGDERRSHILSVIEGNDAATTPAIAFLENPRYRVSGLFRGLTDQLLRGELYIDDRLKGVGISTGDVVLSEDL